MSRVIGGTGTDSQWDTSFWQSPGEAISGGATWAGEPAGALADLLAETAVEATDGVPLLPDGALRFALYIHDPSLDPGTTWGTALWGTAEWSDSVGGWKDVTDRLRGVAWSQGADSPGELPTVGTAALTLDNQDGALSPWATDGEFAYGGSSMFRAGRLFRFGVLEDADGAIFHPYLTGRIESLSEDTESNADAWLTVNLAELTSELAAYPGEVVLDDGGTVSQAMLRVLEALEWRYQDGLEVPDEDALTMSATVGGFQDASYATTLLDQIAAGLHWAYLSDGSGKLRVVKRRSPAARLEPPTFSNDPEGDELPIISVQPYADNARLLNQASASRLAPDDESPNPVVRATNEGSKRTYGLITSGYGFPRDDLVLASDDDVTALVQYVVQLYGFDDLGIDSLALDLDMAPEELILEMDYLATFGAGQPLYVRWVHPSGAVLTEYAVVSGTSWSLTMQGNQAKWLGSITLERAA